MNLAPKDAQFLTALLAGGLLFGGTAGWLLTPAPAPEPALGAHGSRPSAGIAAVAEIRREEVFAAPAPSDAEETTGTPAASPDAATTATAEGLSLPPPAAIPTEEVSGLDNGGVLSLDGSSTGALMIEGLTGDVPSISEPRSLGTPVFIPSPRAGIAAVPPALDSERVVLADQVPETLPLDESAWEPAEFGLLAAPPEESDLLAQIPDGAVVAPVQPLTAEEILATDQSVTPLGYAAPGVGTGAAVPLTESGAVPAAGYLPEGQIQLESAEFLDYDEERSTIYGHGRVVARFGTYKLVADRMLIDTRIRELQAYGNVILTSPNEYVEAESLQFDARNNMGVAYNARGRSGIIYFLADPFDNGGRTTFRQLSRDESHFKHSSFTTCDFPVPHYRINAKEFTIFADDRIFARNVVLYIMEKPVFWLPYYTRSLNDEGPWALKFGTDRQLGFYTRVAYNFRHSSYTPSDVDDRLMVKRSSGQGRVMWDYFSKLGFGRGLQYRYKLDDGKHRGELFLYQFADKERNVGDDDTDRTYANIFHRTYLGKAGDGADLSALVDVDYASDPDIFFDLFDRLRGSGENPRGRISERHSVFGLDRTHDDYFAGIRVELRDRIGRDRFSYFSDPRDGDFDFDRRYNDEEFFELADPGFGPDGNFYDTAGRFSDWRSLPQILDNGVSSDRFGRVSSRLPQLTVSTNRDRLWCLPLWYHLDLNVFNNLDKGLNTLGTHDDSYVTGFDLYQSLTHLHRFSERYTLRTKVGVGVGVAQRLDDSYNPDFPDDVTFPYVHGGQRIDGRIIGVEFVDEDTFLVGRRRMSLSEVDPFFAYGDLDSKFNARVTDSMTAWARYRVRQNVTDNNLGMFYERIGSRSTRDDLYDFRTDEHWIEAGLNYALAFPRLNLSASVGRNLQSESDWTANELTQYMNTSVGWANLKNTITVNAGAALQERQQRDPSDPNAYLANTLSLYLAGSYLPVHQRHYARGGLFFIKNQTDDPLGIDNGDRNFDSEDEVVTDFTLGKRIGQKYLVEYRSRLRTGDDGTNNSTFRVERDFHDAVAGFSVGIRGDRLSNREERTTQDNMQVRFHFRLKPAAEKGVTPVRTSGDLMSARKRSAFETGG